MQDAPRMVPVEAAVRAHKALRAAAGLGPEMFPAEAFVGMISDEIQILRERGRSDDEIVALVHESSGLTLTAEEPGQFYATPEEREQGRRRR